MSRRLPTVTAAGVPPPATFDVIVAGAGAVGLTAAIALARASLEVAVVGPIDVTPTGRTVALLDGSIRLYGALGLWERLAPIAAPLAIMQLIDDTGSLFRPPPVAFHAAEIGLEAFGFNVENHRLIEALAEAAQNTPRLQVIESRIGAFDMRGDQASATLASGAILEAALIVAADGRRSLARAAARIDTKETRCPQSALTAILAHERPHRATSTEFHTRGGAFTLVPLVGTEASPHRCSLVWMMSERQAERRHALGDDEFAAEIEDQAQSMLGRMRLDGARGAFPIASMSARQLTGSRVALVGEAAHVMPPIGAQGLNLGLRDVVHLVECLAAASAGGADLGGAESLAAYRRARRLDIMSRSAGVTMLNRSLLADVLPVDFLRGAGLTALSAIGPLRRLLMREGVMPRGSGPRMMDSRRAR